MPESTSNTLILHFVSHCHWSSVLVHVMSFLGEVETFIRFQLMTCVSYLYLSEAYY